MKSPTADPGSADLITAGTYAFLAQTSISLEDMSSGTTQLVGPSSDDTASAVTNIGFDFWYDGVRQTQFSINANGLARLGSTVIGLQEAVRKGSLFLLYMGHKKRPRHMDKAFPVSESFDSLHSIDRRARRDSWFSSRSRSNWRHHLIAELRLVPFHLHGFLFRTREHALPECPSRSVRRLVRR